MYLHVQSPVSKITVYIDNTARANEKKIRKKKLGVFSFSWSRSLERKCHYPDRNAGAALRYCQRLHNASSLRSTLLKINSMKSSAHINEKCLNKELQPSRAYAYAVGAEFYPSFALQITERYFYFLAIILRHYLLRSSARFPTLRWCSVVERIPWA